MRYLAKITIETGWDEPDGYIEEEFEASSLEEAAEKIRKSVLYNQENFDAAINEEFDYNWCINPDYVEWVEAAQLLNQHHEVERYGHKVSNVTATIIPISDVSITVDISKEWKEQNEDLANAEREKRAKLEWLKRELGED